MTVASLYNFNLGQNWEAVDVTVANYFHHRAYDPSFVMWEFFSNVGHGRCIGIILGSLLLILGLRGMWYRFMTVLMTVPGMFLCEFVKVWVHRARPDPLVEEGYSFPSGHAITAVLAYGLILVLVLPLLKTRGAKWTAFWWTVVLVFFISFARVALEAHFLSDMLISMVWGVVWLLFCLRMTEAVRVWMGRRGARAVVVRGAMVPELVVVKSEEGML